ncbi:AAA family ATPase [Acidianus sulfidivorans JP7]|uniref:ATP-binding protein n=1 Tax=Acidianus sulfidivorans JP7 TaxID=619593 RepID=A0A2U9IJK5_9CREN|nr:ATP-binding protein [Acidianus sulfidivorans]AWR96213.1 AAA family ATPase [Acidianus sulfidivorans JP7]
MEVEEIKRIILDQESFLNDKLRKEKIITRDYDYSIKYNNAYLITGPRRAGKSIFAVQLAKDKEYLRVDFDDERLSGIKGNELNKLLEAGYQIKGNRKIDVIILDEIQNVNGWELFVSRIREIYPVIVTGSNARLMSSEMATYLTGRHIDFLILPFSFKEYLRYKGVEVEETTRGIARLKDELRNYLQQGGFPETFKFDKNEFLRNLYSDIITKDVIIRCRTRKDIKGLADFLLENIGKEVSTRRIGNAFNLSYQSVENYFYCLSNAYLFLFLRRFTGKSLERYTLPRKVYVIDTGFSNFQIGKLMENLVFLELYKRFKDVFYYSNGNAEVDFVVKDKFAIQVTYDESGIDDREYKGLVRFSDRFKNYKLIIVTWDREGKEIRNGKEIELIPLWKFLVKVLGNQLK